MDVKMAEAATQPCSGLRWIELISAMMIMIWTQKFEMTRSSFDHQSYPNSAHPVLLLFKSRKRGVEEGKERTIPSQRKRGYLPLETSVQP